MTAFLFLQRTNMKNKKYISYPNIQSAIRPVPHGAELPVPTPPLSLNDMSHSEIGYLEEK